MSNDLCSPFSCNICLVLKSHQEDHQIPLQVNGTQHLLTCSGCQLVKYCNRQHQKLDWPIHRQFCQAVQKIKHNLNVSHPFYIAGVPQYIGEIEKTIIQLKYLLRNVLGRSLEFQEEELSSFPAYCSQCLKFKNLKVVCTKCDSQNYCSEEHKEMHKEKHAKVCKLLQKYYCPYKVQPTKEDFGFKFKSKIEDLHKLDLLQCFEKIFSVKVPIDPCQTLKTYQLFSWAADFSCIMSICYAMKYLNVQNLNLTKFNIFILGASIEAVLWFREVHCQLFFLQNPQITELVLDFIGPEVVEPAQKEIKSIFLGLERLIKFNVYKGLFQDYCQYYKVNPSLMVAFNCGFSEFSQCYNMSPTITSLNTLEPLDFTCETVNAKDTWYHGLVEVLQTFDTLILFTSFTKQEAQFDFAALQNAANKQRLKVHIDRIFKITKNPYHDLRPLRQWYARDKGEFYYRNGYIQAIRTKLRQ